MITPSKISKIISKIINMIFYLILILRTISLVLFTYYFVLTKNTFSPTIDIDAEILKLKNIYYKLNTTLGLSIAVISVILFNPFYIIDYKINSKFKFMLYYYGVVVIYDFVLMYFTQNHLL
jgi:hypothetical protein